MTREDDSISRKEVLQMIDNIRDAGGFIGFNTYSEAFDQVNNMSSAPRWIPVSERLPEEQDEYLVTWTVKGFRDKPFVRIIEFDVEDREWILDKDMKEIFKDVTITAWQPLPESYKENKK